MARYRLIGHEIQAKEINTAALTYEQQREGREEIVYETDDLNEVKTIAKAGGYSRKDGSFIAVTNVVDTQNIQPTPMPTPTKD